MSDDEDKTILGLPPQMVVRRKKKKKNKKTKRIRASVRRLA